MSDAFVSLNGPIVIKDALELGRSRELVRLIDGGIIPFVRLIECQRDADGASETVIIEVDVERPQAPAYDIRRVERIGIVFRSIDQSYPEALALRDNFPLVPHINHTLQEFPRSLCLYDQAWPEIAIRWTAISFIERIREWLRLTAKGMLHQNDQSLEQLLFGTRLRIILPTEFLDDLATDKPIRLDVHGIARDGCLRNLIAVKPLNEKGEQGALRYVATTFSAEPQTHGIIRSTPNNLFELHDFLTAGGIDLIGDLRRRLADWEAPRLRQASLVLIVAFPLRRTDFDGVERWDFWAFFTMKTVREVGIEIGLWEKVGGELARILRPDNSKRGQTVPIAAVSPYMEFSRIAAATANGIAADSRKVIAVGAGALGSQVIANLARSGFGTWKIVDEDDLLPHNLARHELSGDAVGFSKAQAMAVQLNQLYLGKNPAEGIVADVLSPGEKSAMLDAAYADTDLILDIAASVPVARYLTLDVISPARRMSIFLNPTGTDLVVLAEDKARKFKLDELEMQYYQAAAIKLELTSHLASNLSRLRYGRSCRDITSTMPSHLVSVLAGIGSQAVRMALATDDASIRIWRCEPASLAVTPVELAFTGATRQELGNWTLVVDDALRDRLAGLRRAKLPNETGGVLIGSYDLTRRIVYVVDTIPSPPDSAEWPTLYIRGSDGLLDRVQELGTKSGGQLEYVGEWHSHPDDCPTLPSNDDLIVFTWLTEHMNAAGLPALMAIVGTQTSSSWYLGEISPDTTWRFEC